MTRVLDLLARGAFLFYLPPAIVIAAVAFLGQEGPARLADPKFDEARAWRLLEDLVALGPRHDEAVREAAFARVQADAAEWGAARVRALTFEGPPGDGIDYYENTARRGFDVIAEIPGDGPRADERIAVIGHFDTVKGSPGALDDAVGVAMLAGLGPALAGRKLPRTVVLAAVDLEERGLVGTRHFVDAEEKAGRLGQYRAAVSTEMLGWKDGVPVLHTFPSAFHGPPERRPQGGGLAPRWLAGLALAAGRDNDRPLHFGDRWLAPIYHLVFRHFVTPFESDSGVFGARGIPALFLSDCSFTSFYPEYHKPTDGLDQVDRADFARAGRALEAFVVALATRDALPPPGERGVPEAETDYLTFGAVLLPALTIRIALALAPLPFLLLAWRRARTADRAAAFALPLGLGLFAATALALVIAPVSAFVVLFAAWLAAPLALLPSRRARFLGLFLALLPALAVAAVYVAASMLFQSFIAPAHRGPALALEAAVALGLGAVAFLPRRTRRVV